MGPAGGDEGVPALKRAIDAPLRHYDKEFNRAPLFIPQADPERLCAIRATERVLMPERGATPNKLEKRGRCTYFKITDVGSTHWPFEISAASPFFASVQN
ncbi:MAG TPA: hypothetical protein VMZ06_05760 [Candidatus Bathyarchaeia archaeon]|nr:hypothetical protein [Candidatus Bathyarchaeia archaeon]